MNRQNALLYLMRRIATCNHLLATRPLCMTDWDIHEDWIWNSVDMGMRYYCFYWEKN